VQFIANSRLFRRLSHDRTIATTIALQQIATYNMASEAGFYSIKAQELCITCRTTILSTDPTILPKSPQHLNFNEYATHHETLVNLEAAVEGGCYICTRVKRHALGDNELAAFDQHQWTLQNPITKYNILQWNKPQPQSSVLVDIHTKYIQTRFTLYRSQGNFPSLLLQSPLMNAF